MQKSASGKKKIKIVTKPMMTGRAVDEATFKRALRVAGTTLVAVIIYLLFAAGMGLIARGLWRRSRLARTPMVLAQVFGLVSAWLFWEGDGAAVVAGVVIAVVCVIGIVLTLRPATGADLLD